MLRARARTGMNPLNMLAACVRALARAKTKERTEGLHVRLWPRSFSATCSRTKRSTTLFVTGGKRDNGRRVVWSCLADHICNTYTASAYSANANCRELNDGIISMMVMLWLCPVRARAIAKVPGDHVPSAYGQWMCVCVGSRERYVLWHTHTCRRAVWCLWLRAFCVSAYDVRNNQRIPSLRQTIATELANIAALSTVQDM